MPDKIKILYGLEAVGGGALKHLTYLAKNLNKDLFDITAILSINHYENIDDTKTILYNSGVKLIEIPMKRSFSLRNLKSIYNLLKHIKKEKYSIVHAHSSIAGGFFRIAAWLAKTPAIYYTPHCFYFKGKKGLKKKLYLCIEKLLALLTSAIIISEKEIEDTLNYKIVPSKKIYSINNAVDFKDYQKTYETDIIKRHYGLDDKSVAIGAVGRLVTQKDWKTYIHAANEVVKIFPHVKFFIVGDGELYCTIKNLIISLHLNQNIILTQHLTSSRVSELFSIIDIYVNTSKWEGLPYVLLEAMHHKIPIIATLSGGKTVVLHEKTGYLVYDGDYKAVAHKIIHLIKNKPLAKRMGEEGYKQLSEKYSFDAFVKKHEYIYLHYNKPKTT